MKRVKTKGLILKRTDYKEADRIVSILTKDLGRVSALVKGARKPKSRMAGGIEPFVVSNIDFLETKNELKTVVSARITEDYTDVIRDYDRAALAGEMLKLLNDLIEDDVDESFFNLARDLLIALNDDTIDQDIIETWFRLQLSARLGREPDLVHDAKGEKLDESNSYHFDPSEGSFTVSAAGSFSSNSIKAWRVLLLKNPVDARRVKGLAKETKSTLPALRLFMANNSF